MFNKINMCLSFCVFSCCMKANQQFFNMKLINENLSHEYFAVYGICC